MTISSILMTEICLELLRGAFRDGALSRRKLYAKIAAGKIGVKRVRLPATAELKESDRFSGGIRHQKLCAVAAKWLDLKGIPWNCGPDSCNIRGGGGTDKFSCTADRIGVADVIAVDRSIAVECGTTKASKVVKVCSLGIDVLHIPYPGKYGVLFKRLIEFDPLTNP